MTDSAAELPIEVFDIGLQLERTALSWQRATLSFAGAALVGARLLMDVWGIISFLVGALGLIMVVLVFVGASRRYSRNLAHLTRPGGGQALVTGAAPLLLCAVVTLGIGICGIAFVFS